MAIGIRVAHPVPPVHTSAGSTTRVRCSTSSSIRSKVPSSSSSTSSSVADAGAGVRVSWLEDLFLGSNLPPPAQHARNRLRVAYQGARGSYCQEAATTAFPYASTISPCVHMEEAFSAIEDGCADRAIIPLENSLDGSIPRNLDLLLRHPAVHILGEHILAVNHCLIAHPFTSPHSIRRVVSHPQALAHCGDRIRQLGVAVEEVPCVAAAARLLAEDAIQDTAVIGSRMAAVEYGLSVLEDNVQDSTTAPNMTRFLQLAASKTEHDECYKSDVHNKCTVAFVLKKGPTDMFRAMWAFESRGVQVTRVDHRPNRGRPVRVGVSVSMDYVFILDVQGARPRVEAAVAGLEEFAESVRILGKYQICQ